MSAATQYPHVSLDRSGQPHIEGTRYKIALLAAEHYHYGWSAEELLRQHPDLRPEQIYGALVYFYDHFDAVVASMQNSTHEVDQLRRRQALTRNELLARAAFSCAKKG